MILKAMPMLVAATTFMGTQPLAAQYATGLGTVTSTIIEDGHTRVDANISVTSPQLQTRTSSFVAKFIPWDKNNDWKDFYLEVKFPLIISRKLIVGNTCKSVEENLPDLVYYSFDDMSKDSRLSIDFHSNNSRFMGIRFTDNFDYNGAGSDCYYPGTGGGGDDDGGCDPTNPMCRSGIDNYYDPYIPPRWEYEKFITKTANVVFKFGIFSNNILMAPITQVRTDWNAMPVRHSVVDVLAVEACIKAIAALTQAAGIPFVGQFLVLLFEDSDYKKPADYWYGNESRNVSLRN